MYTESNKYYAQYHEPDLYGNIEQDKQYAYSYAQPAPKIAPREESFHKKSPFAYYYNISQGEVLLLCT